MMGSHGGGSLTAVWVTILEDACPPSDGQTLVTWQVAPVTEFELCSLEHAAAVLSDAVSRVVTSIMPPRVSVYVDGQGRAILSCMIYETIAQVFTDNIAEDMQLASHETVVAASTNRPVDMSGLSCGVLCHAGRVPQGPG